MEIGGRKIDVLLKDAASPMRSFLRLPSLWGFTLSRCYLLEYAKSLASGSKLIESI